MEKWSRLFIWSIIRFYLYLIFTDHWIWLLKSPEFWSHYSLKRLFQEFYFGFYFVVFFRCFVNLLRGHYYYLAKFVYEFIFKYRLNSYKVIQIFRKIQMSWVVAVRLGLWNVHNILGCRPIRGTSNHNVIDIYDNIPNINQESEKFTKRLVNTNTLSTMKM